MLIYFSYFMILLQQTKLVILVDENIIVRNCIFIPAYKKITFKSNPYLNFFLT